MSVEIFRDRITDLGRHLQIDALSINEANVCNVGLSDGSWLHISFGEADALVHWTAVIRGIEGSDTVQMLSGLLAANLDWRLMKGAYFALDDMAAVVVLRFHEPASNLHAQRFIEVTERFAGVAEFWRERVAAQVERMAANASAAGPSSEAPSAAAVFQQHV